MSYQRLGTAKLLFRMLLMIKQPKRVAAISAKDEKFGLESQESDFAMCEQGKGTAYLLTDSPAIGGYLS